LKNPTEGFKSLIDNLLFMSEKIAEYVKSFVGGKSVRERLRNIVLYIGQKCENEDVQKVDGSLLMASKTELDLLVGSKILEQPTGRTYKLTEKRGKEVFELIKKEVDLEGHGGEL